MARGRPYRFRRFARGLNTADGQYNLREGYQDDPQGLGSECRDVLNAVSQDRGNVSKRDGSQTLKTKTGIKDISVVETGSGGRIIYSTTAGALFTLDAALTETSLVASGLSASAPWTFLHLPTNGGQGPYYGMNGTDTPRQVTVGLAIANWTASTGSIPNGKYMVYAGGRLWVTGVAADPTAVYWSDIGNPRSFPVENVTRFNPDDGQSNTGLASLGPYVLVFKADAIWRIYNLDTSANMKFADNAGTSSPYSVVATAGGCFFLDPQRGVMITDGQDVREVGTQILPTFHRISAGDLATATAAFWNGHYYLGARLDGGTFYTLDYHVELKSWWLHSHQAKALAVWNRGSDDQLVAAHPTTLARLLVPGEPLDEGVAFRSFWSGPFHDFGASHLLKRCREVQMDGSGKVDVYVHSDFLPGPGSFEKTADFTSGNPLFGGAGNFGGEGTFGGGVTIGEDSLFSLGRGRVWALTIGNETADPWQLDSYVMLMDTSKD